SCAFHGLRRRSWPTARGAVSWGPASCFGRIETQRVQRCARMEKGLNGGASRQTIPMSQKQRLAQLSVPGPKAQGLAFVPIERDIALPQGLELLRGAGLAITGGDFHHGPHCHPRGPVVAAHRPPAELGE